MSRARIALVTLAALTLLGLLGLLAVTAFGPIELIVDGRDIGAELRGLVSVPEGDRVGWAIGLWITLVIFVSVALFALPFALLQGLVLAAIALAVMLLVLGLSLVAALLLIAPVIAAVALFVWATRRVKTRIAR